MLITHLDLAHLLASSDHADFSARRKLEDVSISIAKAKKVIVVSGAGISCSSGIPDFRSADGLYSLVKRRYPDAFVTGRDLFSAGLFMNPSTTAIFLTFIAELSLACQKATPTRTHHFIHKLDRTGKLLRSYTQNVDGFERRMGMDSGGRGKGLHKKTTRNVELHGDLGRVRCTLCFTDYAADKGWVEMMREGEAPECPKCLERCSSRLKRSARATPIGSLRPSIVLYDEPHPLGDDIGTLQAHDMSKTPDVMIIMGTSLKVSGLKALVKDFAKAIHGATKPGLVVFVNATKPGKEWEGVIDVHVQGETDAWVDKVEEVWRRVKPADWEVQTRLDMPVVGSASVAKEKGKGHGKVMPIVEMPIPRSSQSPSQSRSRSSTLSTLPSPPSAPLSPSKRRNMPTPDPTPSPKKLRAAAPSTGVASTPGKGNLFAARSGPPSVDDDFGMPASQESLVMASQSMAMADDDEEEEGEGEGDDVVVDETLRVPGDDVDQSDDTEDERDDEHSDVARRTTTISSRAQRAASRASSGTTSAPSLSSPQLTTKALRASRTSVNDKRTTYPAEKMRGSQRNKENAAPPSYESIMGPVTAKKPVSAQRKAKVPCSPLKTRTAARAADIRATRTRGARGVMVARRSNRLE